jgi:hypothetical protein
MTLFGETVKVLGMTGMKGRVEGEGSCALWYLSVYVCLMLILMFGLLVI